MVVCSQREVRDIHAEHQDYRAHGRQSNATRYPCAVIGRVFEIVVFGGSEDAAGALDAVLNRGQQMGEDWAVTPVLV
jgi:hypothetical protein